MPCVVAERGTFDFTLSASRLSMKPHAGVCLAQRRSLRTQHLIEPDVLRKTSKSNKTVKDIFGRKNKGKSNKTAKKTDSTCSEKHDSTEGDDGAKNMPDTTDELDARSRGTGGGQNIFSDQDKNSREIECSETGQSSPVKHSAGTLNTDSEFFHQELVASRTFDSTWSLNPQSPTTNDGENLFSTCENFLQLPAPPHPNRAAGSPEWNSSVPCSASSLSPQSCSGRVGSFSRPLSPMSVSPDSSVGQTYSSLLADLNNPDLVLDKFLLNELPPTEMRDFQSPPPICVSLSESSVVSSVSVSDADASLVSSNGAGRVGSDDGQQHQQQNTSFLDDACMNFEADKVNDNHFDVLEGYSFLW